MKYSRQYMYSGGTITVQCGHYFLQSKSQFCLVPHFGSAIAELDTLQKHKFPTFRMGLI